MVCIFLTISAVSAADNLNSTNYGANSNSQEITSDSGSNVNIYVSPTGDDSNTGKSSSSSLKTINASLSKVNESDNAIIYLGEGTFSGDGNNMIDINLAHNNYNGSLTFIGAGYNKTFIDGENQYKLFTISADSRVNFINLTFINAKDNTGGVMTNKGNVSFDACIFENNTATSQGGVLYTEGLSTTIVKDSVFINNHASYDGGVAYMSGNASFINSKFINSSVNSGNWNNGGAIELNQAINFDLIACEFYNSSAAKGGVGYLLGTNQNNGRVSVFNIKNNKFVNCTATSTDVNGDVLYILNAKTVNFSNNTVSEPGNNAPFYIYEGSTAENLNLVFMNNSTVDINSPTFNLYASLVDDMGNKIAGGLVYFYINDKNVASSELKKGVASTSVTNLLDNGVYTVSGYYQNGDNTTNIKTGSIKFYVNRDPIELYVSPSGNDETGDGSKDNPFKSLKKAINTGFENHVNVIINLAEGTYAAENNTGISVNNIGFLKIRGNGYNKTIIDGNGIKSKFISFGTYVSADISNMSFINGNYYSGLISNQFDSDAFINMTDCIFENMSYALFTSNGNFVNCTFINASAMVRNSLINSSKFIGFSGSNPALTLITSNVYNTLFENNAGGAIKAYQGIPMHHGVSYIIDNCTFVNNSAENGGAIGFETSSMTSGDRIAIINGCTFVNNSAEYGGALAVDSSMNITVSNNKFINNTAKYGGALVLGTTKERFDSNGNITLKNNTMTNNMASIEANEIYALKSNVNAYVKFNDLTATKLSDNLSAIVTDDMGNKISGGYISYYLNEAYVGKSSLINGSSSLIYVGFRNGTYTLNGDYSYGVNRSNNKKGTVIVKIENIEDNIRLYVSPDGSDENGDGTKSNPFKTIQHAYDFGTGKSTNIFIQLLNGTFVGLGNVNLNISGNINVTINGEGVDSTILNETPLDNFAQPSITVTPGNQRFVLSNLTFTEGVAKYNKKNTTNYAENIIIPNGISALFENVKFTNNHGNTGGVVSNNGDLTVINCTFFNNGDSYIASTIFNNNTVNIVNSKFILNHAALSTITNNGNMTILSSRFEDDLRSGFMSFFYRIKNSGYAEVNDTEFVITGKSQSEILGIIGNNTVQYGNTNKADADNPLCSNCLFNNGTIIYANDRFEDNPGKVKYHGAKSGWMQSSQWGSHGEVVQIDGNNTVINSTFVNIQELDIINPNSVIIEGCVFDNLSKMKTTLTLTSGAYSNYLNNVSFVNNVVLFNETVSNPFSVSGQNNGNLNFNCNWWGNNTKPNSDIIDNWLVLTLDNITNGNLGQNFTFGFKVSDGENLSDYDGNLPTRTFEFETNDGEINPVSGNITNSQNAEFSSKTTGNKTLNLTVDNQVLVYNTTVYKASVLNIGSIVTLGNSALITLTDAEGNPISGDIIVTVNGVEYQVNVKDGKVEFTPDEFTKTGKYNVVLHYAGNDEYLPSNVETDVSVLKLSKTTIDVDDNGNIIIKLTDAEGNPISNASVKSLINDTNSNTFITDDNGVANITSLTGKFKFTAIFNGNDEFLGSNESDNLLIIPKTRTATNIVSSDFSQTAVDFYHGERGGYFTVILKDSDGNVLANKPVSVGFNGVVYNLVTGADGVARLQINLAWSGIYTFAVAFLGDDEYNGSFVVNKITVSPKITSIAVGGLSPVKVGVYRTLTFALKGTSALDGKKSVNGVGKQLVVTVNGRSYNLRTDRNGRVSLRVRFARAGTYTVTTRFAGDGTFAARSVSSRITVRR
ncbi:MAG: hypothetical protein ACI4VU_03475 [Methanobrevibacter sp.]